MHRQLAAKSCITGTTLKWLEQNRKQLVKEYNIDAYHKAHAKWLKGKSYKIEDIRSGFERFKKTFKVPQNMMDMLLDKAKEEKIEYTDSMYQVTLPQLKLQMKALVARDLWDMSEYYEIINPISEIYNQGLKAIKQEDLFENINE